MKTRTRIVTLLAVVAATTAAAVTFAVAADESPEERATDVPCAPPGGPKGPMGHDHGQGNHSGGMPGDHQARHADGAHGSGHMASRPGGMVHGQEHQAMRAAHCGEHQAMMESCHLQEGNETCQARMQAHQAEHREAMQDRMMDRCLSRHTQEECEERQAQMESCRAMTPDERKAADCPAPPPPGRHHHA